MDNSQASTNQPMPQQQQQHSNLIRTDQVQKLPHLNEQQKAQHTQLVRGLWELLNSRDQQSQEYQNGHMKLAQLSQNLMKGMRAFQQSRQQQALQQQQAQAAGQGGQRSQSANPQNFAQLLPQIQTKVNALQFFLPPNINKEQIQSWLPEARLRYGIALQKQEVGRARITELRQHFSQRQGSGNMGQDEVQEFKNRQLAAEKLYREGSDFLNKFKEQQENFKQNQVNRAGVQNPAAQQAATPEQRAASATNENRPNAPMQAGQAPTPAPHTINSAVNAARNSQAGQSMSPSTSQPGQPATTQPQVPATSLPQQPQQPQTQGAGQAPLNQPPNMDGATQAQGPPRPLSHQAAMAQAAQNYSNASNANTTSTATNTASNMTPQSLNQAAANPHAHPQGYIPSRPDSTIRNMNMAIPKSLNVSTPEPVSMAPARPTLSGGPSHGAMGMMGQPAIQKHPGYVLEGEGQRVLSKKMLDGLVRQVTGGGEEEGLTPDAEDFILQMADDFVDDVITAACRLAKLRSSSTLDIRDIQLILERNYNMRISGFSSDDLRTVKKPQPAQGWTQKMSAVQAAKVTQGRTE